MKGMDIFCASQAASEIRLSTMEEPSSSSSSAHLSGTRAIDRHNPIIRDGRRATKSFPALAPPCASQTPPLTPIPYKQLHHKARKTTTTSYSSSSSKAKKSSANKKGLISSSKGEGEGEGEGEGDAVRKSGVTLGDFISPPGSTRYLLGEPGFFDAASDFEPGLGLVHVDNSGKAKAVSQDESLGSNPRPPSSTSSHSPDQVVVLRVSLHCKGCEGKVRKHISRMQGVTSFNIDFAAKKVTVVGDVTPLGVLSSISKVKTAQLWTPAMASSVPTPTSNFSEIEKSKGHITS